MSKGEDIQGEGVNVAAQIEGMAEPGGICFSGLVYDRIKNKLTFTYEYLGEQSLNNIDDPVRLYRILLGINEAPVTEPEVELSIPDKPSIVVLPFDNMSSEPEQVYFSDGLFYCLSTVARNPITVFRKDEYFDKRLKIPSICAFIA